MSYYYEPQSICCALNMLISMFDTMARPIESSYTNYVIIAVFVCQTICCGAEKMNARFNSFICYLVDNGSHQWTIFSPFPF